MPAQPLRTALIGLSSSAVTSWAASAHLPALVSPTGKSKFAIHGLLNSSVAAAETAIAAFKLPQGTKAYESPEALAADEDVQLVICNTRVDKHFATVLPSVRAGKDVFIEWPIAANAAQIGELVQTARESGSRVAVGLQRRWNPVVGRVRELVQDRTLGKVLSVEVRLFGGVNDRELLPAGLKYFTKKEIGGNVVVIGVGHALDSLLSVVGNVELSTVQAKTQIQRPNVPILDPATRKIVETVTSDVPDLVSFNAQLQVAPHVADKATVSFLFRRGQPFPDTPCLTWAINMEHGEIRVVSPSSTSLETGEKDKPISIHVHRFENGSVEEAKWDWSPEQAVLPLMARSVSATLYAFADGRVAGDGWVSLEDAAQRAELIERILDA